ncbi:MAG: redoxin domain-containing protein, partial [Spirochaetia bacterium]|nr:redoxin domain-containing protein [Spirochaetia bacterium]
MKLFNKILAFSTATLWLASFAFADVEIGGAAPTFKLKDAQDKERSLSEFKGKYVVLEWYNKDCPFVKKHYESGNMTSLQEKYKAKGIVWLSIISSADGKQGFCSAEETAQLATEKKNLASAILRDADGSVGRLYGAKTTPHMFIIDPKGVVQYNGAIDDKATAKQEDIQSAINY